MEKYIEQNGITYELRGEQYYPLLELPEQKEIGKYGRLHLNISKSIARGATPIFSRKMRSINGSMRLTLKQRLWLKASSPALSMKEVLTKT